jgi:DNA repair protein RecO (recombination protein O)
MKLESVGILIGLRPFEERDCIATIFTRDFGIMKGMLRGAAVAKKNKPLVGQMGAVSWNARLDSQLGVFHFEAQKNLIAPIMSDMQALGFANSVFELLSAFLPEREKYPALYDETLKVLIGAELSAQLSWEITLLRELGYALDFTRCSACGRADNLTNISQRTGRAVCEACAAPWLHKCFPLPINRTATKFFLEKAAADLGIKNSATFFSC